MSVSLRFLVGKVFKQKRELPAGNPLFSYNVLGLLQCFLSKLPASQGTYKYGTQAKSGYKKRRYEQHLWECHALPP
jgi:hypothetical protein